MAAKLNLFCIIRLLFCTLSFRFVSLCSDLFRVILFESLTNFAAGDDASLAFWDSSRAEQCETLPTMFDDELTMLIIFGKHYKTLKAATPSPLDQPACCPSLLAKLLPLLRLLPLSLLARVCVCVRALTERMCVYVCGF